MGLRLSFVSASRDDVQLFGLGKEGRALADRAMATAARNETACEMPWDQALAGWTARYRTAIAGIDQVGARRAALFEIGQEMGDWLNTALGGFDQWPLTAGRRHLEIAVPALAEAEAHLLLDAPWELLADRHAHLASQETVFVVWRSHGRKPEGSTLWQPRHGNLALMFMAASPEDVTELDYEAEEAAILTRPRGLTALRCTWRRPAACAICESG